MSKKHGSRFPNLVDLVTSNAEENTTTLTIVETEPWDGSDERLEQLQQKFNNYLAYGLDGQLIRDFPDSAGDRLRILLDTVHPPDEKTVAFLEKAKAVFKRHDVQFRLGLHA